MRKSSPSQKTWVDCLGATENQFDWINSAIDGVTVQLNHLTPSQCVEFKRSLPKATSPKPGPYRFDVTPYCREILDNFDPDSPIREIVIMKGAQLGLTTGILENAIFYAMDYLKTTPCMLLTADDALARARLDQFVMPMITESGLGHLIKPADESNKKKTGATLNRISWYGGGGVFAAGAVNPKNGRSFPIQWMLRDEVDGFPISVGADGCPLAVSAKRTLAFKQTYKMLDISTPTLKDVSKIHPRFLLGDQRYYFVCCLKCGFPQVMRWSVERNDGRRAGVVWETQDGRLVPGSSRWLCAECLHPHVNADKIKLLDPSYGAEWKPTAVPHAPHIRSYHLSGLYSPVGMNTFDSMVLEWLEAWDVERNKPRSLGSAQAFYNTVLGVPWELTGARVAFEQVSAHRRLDYKFGEIPNKWAMRACGSKVLFLVCTVDVNGSDLGVAVWGWCRDRRVILVDYWRLETEESTDRIDEPNTWGALRSILENREYMADDGTIYRFAVCFIDSRFNTDVVKQFCRFFPAGGVFPIMGRKTAVKGGFQNWAKFEDSQGNMGFHVTVDHYKDVWYSALKKDWQADKLQPDTFFNAPIDVTDRQLRQLTVETQQAPERGKDQNPVWVRPQGADNTLWDLLVYAHAAHDVLATYCQRDILGCQFVVLDAFWDHCESGILDNHLNKVKAEQAA